MKLRLLGRTGIKVSELCFGTMTFGGGGFFQNLGAVGQKEADLLIKIALEAGVNFFDTAESYSDGLAEIILGRALGRQRKEVIITTKIRVRKGSNPNVTGLSRHNIIRACDASLKRLGTDYIDLYLAHHFDFDTPLEETLRAFDDLVRQGKVRYIGCSNFAAWQIMKATAISDKNHWERFSALQALYSLIARDIEHELVPVCLDQGLGILTWSPLGGGFLTGKYRRGQPLPQGTRLNDPKLRFTKFDQETGYDIVEDLDLIGKTHNATVSQAALNYLLRKPGVTSVILGARDGEQLRDNLKSSDWEMTPEEFNRLQKMSEPAPVYPHYIYENL